MTKRLDENIGAMDYDGLFASGRYNPDIMGVKIAAGQGELLRGTVLAFASIGSNAVIGGKASKKATVTLTSREGTVAEAGLNTDTLKVYDAEGGDLCALTTDYTIAYSSGTLTITATDDGVLAAAASCYIVCNYADGSEPVASCILAEDIDTGADTTAAALFGQAYRSGHFCRNKLIVAEGDTLSKTDEDNLRKYGIYLDNSME